MGDITNVIEGADIFSGTSSEGGKQSNGIIVATTYHADRVIEKQQNMNDISLQHTSYIDGLVPKNIENREHIIQELGYHVKLIHFIFEQLETSECLEAVIAELLPIYFQQLHNRLNHGDIGVLDKKRHYLDRSFTQMSIQTIPEEALECIKRDFKTTPQLDIDIDFLQNQMRQDEKYILDVFSYLYKNTSLQESLKHVLIILARFEHYRQVFYDYMEHIITNQGGSHLYTQPGYHPEFVVDTYTACMSDIEDFLENLISPDIQSREQLVEYGRRRAECMYIYLEESTTYNQLEALEVMKHILTKKWYQPYVSKGLSHSNEQTLADSEEKQDIKDLINDIQKNAIRDFCRDNGIIGNFQDEIQDIYEEIQRDMYIVYDLLIYLRDHKGAEYDDAHIRYVISMTCMSHYTDVYNTLKQENNK